MRRFVAFFVICLFLISAPGFAGALDIVSINFDDVNGYIGYVSTNPLREEYASRGVHFRGAAEKDGGAILIAGAIGFSAPSPLNVLAFNSQAILANGGTARGPEFISFDNLWNTVSFWVNPQIYQYFSDSPSFSVIQYEGNNKDQSASFSFTAPASSWTQISISSEKGIKAIELSRTDSLGNAFTLDDLVLTSPVTPTPEPGTIIMLGLGLIGIGIFLKLRKK